MADHGVKVSLPGKSVFSTVPEDFVFHSKYGSVKIAQEPPNKAPVDVTVAGSTTTDTTIAHNLGFIPLCLIFAERTPSSGRYYFGSVYPGVEDRTTPLRVIAGVGSTYLDATNLVIKFTNDKSSSQTIKLYYFIFGDAGS